MLEPVFMRVAGHKWLGRRMGTGCRGFCGFAWGGIKAEANAEGAEGIRERTQRAQRLRKSRKRNTKIIWEMLEPVFMRVAGHKWLGRRMGAGCRGFCGFAWGGIKAEANAEGAEGIRERTQRAQKLRRSRKREYQICLGNARTNIYAGCRT